MKIRFVSNTHLKTCSEVQIFIFVPVKNQKIWTSFAYANQFSSTASRIGDLDVIHYKK